jgi:predicted transposase YdaD
MLQSIEEVGMEKGMEKGIEQEKEATAKKLLLSQWLTKEQISEITGLDREKLEKLEKHLKSE